MVKITEVSVSRTARVNLGDYQSTDLFLSVKAVSDHPEESLTREEIHGVARAAESTLLDWLVKLYKAKGKSASPYEIAKTFGLAAAKQRNDMKKDGGDE